MAVTADGDGQGGAPTAPADDDDVDRHHLLLLLLLLPPAVPGQGVLEPWRCRKYKTVLAGLCAKIFDSGSEVGARLGIADPMRLLGEMNFPAALMPFLS